MLIIQCRALTIVLLFCSLFGGDIQISTEKVHLSIIGIVLAIVAWIYMLRWEMRAKAYAAPWRGKHRAAQERLEALMEEREKSLTILYRLRNPSMTQDDVEMIDFLTDRRDVFNRQGAPSAPCQTFETEIWLKQIVQGIERIGVEIQAVQKEIATCAAEIHGLRANPIYGSLIKPV